MNPSSGSTTNVGIDDDKTGMMEATAANLVDGGKRSDTPAMAAAKSKVPASPQLLPPKPAPSSSLDLDPSLFQLTEEEKEFALNVKEAIEALPDLDNLNDFMYVNLSMMGDLEWAVGRAYQMQQVREEYDIRVSYQDGAKALADMLELLPEVWMSYTFNLQQGKSVMVMDACKCQQAICGDPRNMAILCKGGFYAMYATHPCIDIIRKGKVDIFECQGWQWSAQEMVTVASWAQFTSLSVGTFPSHVVTKFYHTPMMANIFVSMSKKLIPKDVVSKFEVGCQFAGGRLDKFYMVPTPQAASKRCLANLCHGLQIRMESEKIFSLGNCKVVGDD